MPGAIDSMSRTATTTAPESSATRRRRLGTSSTNATATIAPHTTGGAQRNDSTVKRPMPTSEPTRSQRYAVSGVRSAKQRPTISAGPAITSATTTKTTGSTSQAGGPVAWSEVK